MAHSNRCRLHATFSPRSALKQSLWASPWTSYPRVFCQHNILGN
jgi:hypothetical protein